MPHLRHLTVDLGELPKSEDLPVEISPHSWRWPIEQIVFTGMDHFNLYFHISGCKVIFSELCLGEEDARLQMRHTSNNYPWFTLVVQPDAAVAIGCCWGGPPTTDEDKILWEQYQQEMQEAASRPLPDEDNADL